ncbi:MAG: hypothetical protein AB7O97_22165 [Planctomycetota bacterium]
MQRDEFLLDNRPLGPADRAPQRVLARVPRVTGSVIDAIAGAPVEDFAVALVPRAAGAACFAPCRRLTVKGRANGTTSGSGKRDDSGWGRTEVSAELPLR